MKQLSTTVPDDIFERWMEACEQEGIKSFQRLRKCVEYSLEEVPVPPVPPEKEPRGLAIDAYLNTISKGKV